MIENFITHIGTCKTGTTSIQQALLQHEEWLKQQDIFVIDRLRDFEEVSKWLFPQWYDIEDLTQQESRAIGQILSLKQAAIGYATVVYSEENFTDVLSPLEQLSRAKKLKFIVDMFAAQHNHIHVFFRTPSSLLFSWYKQLLRNRNYNNSSYQNFIQQHKDDIAQACDWQAYQQQLEHTLGQGLLQVHDYATAAAGGLCGYFFSNILAIKDLNITELQHNPSQSDLTTQLLQSVAALANDGKLSLHNAGWLKQVILNMADNPNSNDYDLSAENQTLLQSLDAQQQHHFGSRSQV